MADTVLVRLKNNWFGPGGTLYESVDNPHEFPATWADPPKQNDDESKEDFEARKKASKYSVLPNGAEIIEGGKTVAVLVQTADGSEHLQAQAVDGDVKSVGGAVDDKGVEQPSQSVAKAVAGAKEQGVDQVGGKPKESGPPSQAGMKK